MKAYRQSAVHETLPSPDPDQVRANDGHDREGHPDASKKVKHERRAHSKRVLEIDRELMPDVIDVLRQGRERWK